ncbi:adenosine deaminase-like protein [Diachasma alloeum]|uniref:adenosine deaminase-like protein n=1 Tax=Diachasma alloeum TaxID=454923 RepID=UPI0007384D25|nr:adenosine deaminase-like protein [Diachasma alloeum]
MDLRSFCEALPKIELHAHLNGSVSPQTLKKLQKLKGNDDESIPDIEMFTSLKECFQMFNLVHSLTDTPEAVFLATCDVIQEFHDDNVIYLELRSTPRSVKGQMTKEEYIEAIIKAIETCKFKTPGILVKLLISVNRKDGSANAEENIKLAIKCHGEHPMTIVGIDLSGDPTEGEAYIKLLQDCRDVGLKIAAHCAEVPNEEEVIDILNFKPDRLGHCTNIHPNLKGTEKIYKMLLDSRIPVELCLTSNMKCKTVASITEHQFAYFYTEKHPVCISTDDKGVFNTSLSAEFQLAGKHFGLDNEELKDLSLSAVEYSFATNEEKCKLSEKIRLFSCSK